MERSPGGSAAKRSRVGDEEIAPHGDVHAQALGALFADIARYSRVEASDPDNVPAAERKNAVALMGALESLVSYKLVSKALAISTRAHAVVEYRSRDTQRSCYRVQGDEGNYKVLPGFCSCHNYAERLHASAIPLCKHLLALALCLAQNKVDVRIVPDEEWSKYALREVADL